VGAVALQQAVSLAPAWTQYASDLLRTAFALGFVCLLAWVALRWLATRGVGKASGHKRLEVLERLNLDAQRSLWLVRVDRRRLLIGVGTGAAPQLLAELDADVRGAEVSGTVVSADVAAIQGAHKSDATH
jgi:flagellar biogenesis protein FliO